VSRAASRYKIGAVITVNDRMQQDYSYTLTAAGFSGIAGII
jgi:hypothetical protein